MRHPAQINLREVRHYLGRCQRDGLLEAKKIPFNNGVVLVGNPIGGDRPDRKGNESPDPGPKNGIPSHIAIYLLLRSTPLGKSSCANLLPGPGRLWSR